jgi:hypothetical protein
MATVNLGSIKFKWKGTYSGATAYTVDDVVEYNGSSYICILASTGNLPTNATYFEQMSSAGTNGTDLTSTLTTQGDILYRDGSGLVRLGAGTSGQALLTGGAGANPSWGDVVSGILQVKSVTLTTAVSFSSSSYADISGLSLAITPSSASNKILVLSHLVTATISSGSFGARLARGGTGISVNTDTGGFTKGSFGGLDHGDTPSDATASGSIVFLDAPASTSSQTYSIQAISPAGDTMYINRAVSSGTIHEHRATSSLTLIEVASAILT